MLRSRVALVAIAALLLLSACANPAADKPKAVVGEATNTSSASPVAGEKYLITS